MSATQPQRKPDLAPADHLFAPRRHAARRRAGGPKGPPWYLDGVYAASSFGSGNEAGAQGEGLRRTDSPKHYQSMSMPQRRIRRSALVVVTGPSRSL
jgi:hypothetical protein